MSSVSRSGSLSNGFQPVVHLDNLETLQDRWAKQNESLRQPAMAAPQLNSPRSLKACDLCGLNADRDLAKLSLRQHLSRVLGDPTVEAKVAALADAIETRAAMQVAVLAFQRAAIGLGTAREKLVAHQGYEDQERVRVRRLASAREVRRQLMAEEAYDRRRRAHTEGGGGSERGGRSGSQRTNGSPSAWSQPSPPATPPISSRARGARSETRRGSLSPTTSEHGGSLSGFQPSPGRDGYLPYLPRNAASLNSNVFGNRTFDRPVSNPSRTSLAYGRADEGSSRGSPQTTSRGGHGTSIGASEDDSLLLREADGGAADAQASCRRRQGPVQTVAVLQQQRPPSSQPSRRPLSGTSVPVAPQLPVAAMHDRTSESLSMEKISPGGRNDLSIASISSSQLGWVMSSPDTAAASSGSRAAPHHPQQQQRQHQAEHATDAAPTSMSHRARESTIATLFPARERRGRAVGNRTSTPPRMTGAAGGKAAAATRLVEKGEGKSCAKSSSATAAARETKGRVVPAPHTELAVSVPLEVDEPLILFCANPAPLCRV